MLAERFYERQLALLEQVVSGTALPELLESIVQLFEAQAIGTRVHVYLPAREASRAESVSPEAITQAGANHHILYVDDEEALAFLASRLLPRVGYRVTGYSDALQELADFRTRAGEFDAVVTDMTMPGLSGPDLVRELWRVRPEIPIIMTSGYIRPEDVEH